jgi:hypothetical protein
VNNVHFNTNIVERGQKPEWKQKFTLYVFFGIWNCVWHSMFKLERAIVGRSVNRAPPMLKLTFAAIHGRISVEAAIQAKDAQLRVIVFHKNGPKDTVVGEADFSLSGLTPNQTWKEWHAIGEDKGKARILLEINLLTDAVRMFVSPIRCSKPVIRTFRHFGRASLLTLFSPSNRPNTDSWPCFSDVHDRLL